MTPQPIPSPPDTTPSSPHPLPTEGAQDTLSPMDSIAAPPPSRPSTVESSVEFPQRVVHSTLLLISLGLTILGMLFDQSAVMGWGAVATLLFALRSLWPTCQVFFAELLNNGQVITGSVGVGVAVLALARVSGTQQFLLRWFQTANWDAVGALGEILGAAGQVLIAILAVFIAWRQYVISKDLTIQQNFLTAQQNLITQQQTIDAYFQGVSDLVLDDEGLLEDWPQERAIAEGRTAAILGSVDGVGKAKIIRFLSRSRLLTPLKRDRRLGRAILDGAGGYEEDRENGLRVIDLGVMLAKANLAETDLRWTDLSDINLVNGNLSGCDLVKSNLSRTILYGANLSGADLKGTRLFFGSIDTACPRSRTDFPDYRTGAFTGAVLEEADFSDVKNLSDEQRHYSCAWGGNRTRSTIPGGCDGIPNRLGR